ncbi:MAG: hypothetical protein R2716_03550 [Microthrixaceae bacterium]
MTMIPAAACRCVTAKASSGVGATDAIRCTTKPWSCSTEQMSSQNCAEPCRASRATTTPLSGASGTSARSTSATAAATCSQSRRFMCAGPGPSGPRMPAVPKLSGDPNSAASR